MNTSENWEVELADEGTTMAEFQKLRTDAVGEMIEVPEVVGILRTSRLYSKLDSFVRDNFIPLSKIREVVEKVEGMKRDPFTYEKDNQGWMGEDMTIGFNAALDSILKMLNKVVDEKRV